ncbi:MAG: NADH-quinone oxidoreductase subunit M, partial [Actinobacteria bacterium]|nr:NADH-quinone oxidoreductase subunit M [Actinomycetota bacterium]
MTLTIIAALPLLGALLISLLGNSQKENIKKLALITSILTFVATAVVALNFEIDRPGFQFVEKYSWIPSLGVNFQFGVDGISLILILL